MRRKFLYWLGLALSLTALPQTASFAQDRNEQVRAAIDRLKSETGPHFDVIWDNPEKVKTLRGKLSLPHTGRPDEAAIEFLRKNSGIFRIDPSLTDLTLEDIRESPTGYHMRLQQTFNTLPVFNAGIGIDLQRDKSVYTAHNGYLSDIDISTVPTLSGDRSIEIAKEAFRLSCSRQKDTKGTTEPCTDVEFSLKETPEAQLGILASSGKPLLVYRIYLYYQSPLSVLEYFIDATSGAVLQKRELVQDIDGAGQVFDPNATNTLYMFGITPQDNDDANGGFAQAYIMKDLRDITLNSTNGYYRLRGPYVNVDDSIEDPFYFAPSGHIRESDPLQFIYRRQNNRFEHVMVYHHIDTNQRYIQSLGFTTVNNRRIVADPHGLSGSDNSHYVGNPLGAGYLAFGEGGVDDAEDADVILHEYGHAIQDNQAPGKYFGCNTEAGALGEGFGDYWASSSTIEMSNFHGFDPACWAEWDGQGCLRRTDGTKHYPDDIVGECHADGEIWSSVLWELLNTFGKTVADTLVLDSHFRINSLLQLPTFTDGAQALLDADVARYTPAHTEQICSIMTARGIVPEGCKQLFIAYDNLLSISDKTGGDMSVYSAGTSACCGLIDIAVDASRIYLVDDETNIWKSYFKQWRQLGPQISGSVEDPRGVTSDGSRFYVTNLGDFTGSGQPRNNKVKVYTSEGVFLFGFGVDNFPDPLALGDPGKLTVDQSNIYVIDRSHVGGWAVLIFDKLGNYISQFGGTAPRVPWAIAVDDARLYLVTNTPTVADDSFLTIYSKSGILISDISLGPDVYRGVAVDGLYIYLVDQTNQSLLILTKDGGFVSQVDLSSSVFGQAPWGVAVDP